MKMKKLWKAASVLAVALALGVGGKTTAYAQSANAAEYGLTEGFTLGDEMAENAMFVQLDWADAKIYGYTPSEVYDNITSMMQCIMYYPDEPMTMDEAYTALKEKGFIDVAEENKAIVFVINPVNGTTYTEDDFQQFDYLMKALAGKTLEGITYKFPYAKFNPNKVYTVGEGQGADFISQYLNDDMYSGIISAHVLVGATKTAETENYAEPALLIDCDEDVIDFYKDINGADAVNFNDTTAPGDTVYYNSTYVMDSGYTPKRVIVSDDTFNAQDAWDVLLKRVWNDVLEYSYFTAGVEDGVVQDRPIADELGLTVNRIDGEEAESEGQSYWYEWVPDEVYDTMENGTGETYPLIVVNHGNGDHPIYEAESNGWVQLAGEERVIVVAMEDIYELGMPPESAANRYGKENAAFIRNVICKKYPVDMSRIYITGFSIGAFVTADTSSADPGLFAAAASLAYPADGYMQIFPYDTNGTDATQYDLPVFYCCGTADGGNTMKNPTDSTKAKVSSTQLYFNQILTFNEMTDQLIDLEDFDYTWYPGENDKKTNRTTGEVTGGYDWWDGTAAQYICQNLDFDKYPFLGYDPLAIKNTTYTQYTTNEGIAMDRYTFFNDENMPMLMFQVNGDMGHNHYYTYARIVWDNFFSHYSRDPETGLLSYDGVESTKILSEVTQAKVDAKAARLENEELKAQIEELKAQIQALKEENAALKLKVTVPSLSVKSTAKKTMKVTVKAIDGVKYQIRYATLKSLKNVKTVNTTSATKVIKNLKSNKRYYVVVRAYQKIAGKTVYSAYSKIRSVKVK